MNLQQKWLRINRKNLPRPFSGRLDPGWTDYSIAVRLPEIARRVIAENSFPGEIVDRIEKMIREIPYGEIREIYHDGYGDWSLWNRILGPYMGQNWLEAPWLVVEFYFYRRILEAIGFFNEGHFLRFDPFQFQKSEGFAAALEPVNDLLLWIDDLMNGGAQPASLLEQLLVHNLEGNRVDLSLWPVKNGKSEQQNDLAGGDKGFLAADDVHRAVEALCSKTIHQLDVLMDNAGMEMLSDLSMVVYLLEHNLAGQAVVHVKPYPVFVSDVIENDVHACVRLLEGQRDQYPRLADFGARISQFLANGKLLIRCEGFWGLPLAFWEMDDEVRQCLSKSDFIVIKGDANYRRLLGDRRWDPFFPFHQVVSYMPAPTLAVRVIKSEPIAGLEPQRFKHMAQTDPQWMKDGKWGLFQFWDGKGADS